MPSSGPGSGGKSLEVPYEWYWLTCLLIRKRADRWAKNRSRQVVGNATLPSLAAGSEIADLIFEVPD